MPKVLRVLVLGGFGNFGARLVQRLERVPGVAVLVGGRHLPSPAAGNHVCIDARSDNLAQVLRSQSVNVLVVAVGPFHPGDYQVAEAAMAASSHYIDLSDCREHVLGISRFDARAKAAGVLVTAGASSVPALSSAVVDHYYPGFYRLERIEYGISAGAQPPGLAAVAAALAYCGERIHSVATRRQRVFGWQGGRWQRFAAPLGWRFLVHCDVPDLDIFPDRYGTPAVVFRAGVARTSNMFGLWLLSWLVRARVLRSAVPLATVLRAVAHGAGMVDSGPGGKRSGMYMQLDGTGAYGQRRRVDWQLVAENNHGPMVPVLAAVALVRKLAGGRGPGAGARPCVGLLTLADWCAELDGLDIRVIQDIALS